ncbi:glutamate racemase [Propionispora hippei]|uniref:Glutamate racemase n=1 Tax=Propionispora hippei DSM 15287 TaxID=1123003 RepID=A0A1M6G1E8_9FIRM|nr:glutamate racemase [Propionispora hippei]SHJ03763.1 glutamate racemase [Propionispora hippei DSM 15287]
MKIGFFDSGIGGMTVLYHALRLLPREDYIYYADTQHVPYGEKSKTDVKKYVFEAVDFLVRQGIKALVIACNTATSIAAKELREKYDFPIIGIEPAVKPAILRSQEQGRRVLVFTTRLTLREEKFNNLVARLDEDHIVDGLALPGLVEFAERFEFNETVVRPYLTTQLAPYKLEEYGTVVLGCTHFPFYKDTMKTIFAPEVDIIDGGKGTAENLARTLQKANKFQQGTGSVDYYMSGNKVQDPQLLQQYGRLLERLQMLDNLQSPTSQRGCQEQSLHYLFP